MLTLLGHIGRVHNVAFSPDATLLASGSEGSTARIWNFPAGTLRHNFKIGGQPDRGMAAIAFAPDGTLFAVGAGAVRLWRVRDGTLLRVLGDTATRIISVAFAPDSRTLAAGSGGAEGRAPTINLWDAAGGQFLRTLPAQHSGAVHSLVFSPDGSLLAAGDEQVRLWGVADGALVRTLSPQTEAELAFSLAFSPDGTTLAAGTGDSAVRLWRVADGALLYALVGHAAAGYVQSIAFSPDGRLLAAGLSASSAVQVWRIPEGTLVRTPEGPPGGVGGVAFSPDGAFLAWGAADGTVCAWHLPEA